MTEIGYDEFRKVDIRAGVVVRAEPYPEARKPALKLWVDFGPEIGQRKSSAQITARYQPQDLIGRQVLAVVNFPPRQIGKFLSETAKSFWCGPKPRSRRAGGCSARPAANSVLPASAGRGHGNRGFRI